MSHDRSAGEVSASHIRMQAQGPRERSYRTPRLTKYGKLRDITMATKGGTKNDNDPSPDKTKL